MIKITNQKIEIYIEKPHTKIHVCHTKQEIGFVGLPKIVVDIMRLCIRIINILGFFF